MRDPKESLSHSKSSISAADQDSAHGTSGLSSPAYNVSSSVDKDPPGKKVRLPEHLGDMQHGDIATKGSDDTNSFAPNDVNQGSIGNCYFLAALMSVAHTNPETLKKNIKKNEDGTYTVRLYKKRKITLSGKLHPVDVTVYPNFPTAVNGEDSANVLANLNPAHAHSGDENANGDLELWVRLYEKAFAVMKGSYEKIGNGGFIEDAMEAITGDKYGYKSTKKRFLIFGTSKDKVKELIIGMVNDNIPVAAGTGGLDESKLSQEDRDFMESNDVVSGHAYSILNADENGVKLRNPWGQGAIVAEPTLTWDQFVRIFVTFTKRK